MSESRRLPGPGDQGRRKVKVGSYEFTGMDRMDRILLIGPCRIPAQSGMTARGRRREIAAWHRPGPGERLRCNSGGLSPFFTGMDRLDRIFPMGVWRIPADAGMTARYGYLKRNATPGERQRCNAGGLSPFFAAMDLQRWNGQDGQDFSDGGLVDSGWRWNDGKVRLPETERYPRRR